MLRLATSFAFSLALAASASLAHADVCVTVDTARDNLSDSERSGARTLVSDAFQQNGQRVVLEGCTEVYAVYHVRLGDAVTVTIYGPKGTRQAKAGSMNELPEVYSQLVRSLISGQQVATSNDTVTRTNVTAAQAVPTRAAADSLWYAQLGYGGITGAGLDSGPAFGFGYRFELDSIGIDASMNFLAGTDDDSNGVNFTLIRLMGLFFADPMANRSAYFGAGLGWGFSAVEDNGIPYGDSGLQVEASAGYEFLRASTIRMFVQADAMLPIYLSDADFFDPATMSNVDDTRYTPRFGLTMGIGWGGNRSIGVRAL